MELKSFSINRREFLQGATATAAVLAATEGRAFAQNPDMAAVVAQIATQHDATVKILQDWIALPSIAAENRNYPEGPEYMAKLAREAGFQHVEVVPTAGKSGVFATLDAGAPTWLAIYFMYDVKQFDPKEWSSPPLEAKLVDKPGIGKCIVGRGATNSKGPETAVLAALHAFKASGKKLPVNIVLICEGEEEIASPNFHEIVFKSEVEAALKKCVGVMIPLGSQSLDGSVEINLGAKGVAELELVSSGEKWGRGPKHDVHSSLEAQVDSPVWHLIQALNTLVKPDGHTPAVEGFLDKVRPLSATEKKIIEDAIPRRSEEGSKKALGVEHWFNDESWHDSLYRLVGQPTINIEGLVAGYTGPGGKTILPHRAVAKIDMRLVPDMTAKGTVELLKAHLAKHGFGDIEVNMSGGYDPTETDPNSKLVKAQIAAYRKAGIDPLVWPRLAGSWPGVTFTGAPLHLAAGQFGLGHGDGAHAPDEYWVIDSANPKVAGMDGAVKSYVEFFYSLA
ncbi:M20/M25/M40 family metallo-hydrolase [Granulicella sp. WH15]|uniref:M20/M25/M40 family metallo-hydrolase n=1 Tax=Granulicella sp. WH15 TaxID=2602070 RepID=UPI0013677766|nr:M20/M25/M40 family metallo-hydrolase [Granulicella sp. WH15]QHN04522.1 M20/M25/M40 family metallo-hydrolase [Granulicella sp. WH15]